MNDSEFIEVVKNNLPNDFSIDTKLRYILYDGKIVGTISQNSNFLRFAPLRLRTIYNNFFFFLYLQEDGTLKATRINHNGKNNEIFDFDDFVTIVRSSSQKRQVNDNEKEAFITRFKEIVESSDLNKFQKSNLHACVGKRLKLFKIWDSYELTEKVEVRIFMALLHKDRNAPKEHEVCRYCSLDSLLKTINNDETAMMSINCMNDTHENSYVDDYLRMENGLRSSYNISDSRKEGNRTFILSCSDIHMKDKLFMWNMYGNESCGVCLKYDVRANYDTDYKIARISYANETGIHPELVFISNLLDNGFISFNQLSSWKHFFKSYEYSGENEIRILVKRNPTPNFNNEKIKIKWVLAKNGIVTPMLLVKNNDKDHTFPLELKEIILGPKCKEADINRTQLQHLLELLGITKERIKVIPSDINSLR